MAERKSRGSIEDYFDYDGTKFKKLLFKTQKWKELYNTTAAHISVISTVIITCAMSIVFNNSDVEEFNSLLFDLMQIVINSSVAMLGFIISGMAILTGTITPQLVKSIDDDKKSDAIIGILFSFYLIGAVIGVNIFLYSLIYIFLRSEFTLRLWITIVCSLIVAYTFFFSIFYSISLLGTCIRFFLVNYKYSCEKKAKE